jgi:hypothetical protein
MPDGYFLVKDTEHVACEMCLVAPDFYKSENLIQLEDQGAWTGVFVVYLVTS